MDKRDDSHPRNFFGMSIVDQTVVMIDASNLFKTLKELKIKIDYLKLLKYLDENLELLRGYYYIATDKPETYNKIKTHLDFLAYNGWTIVSRSIKRNSEHEVIKGGDMDIVMAKDMMKIAYTLPKVNHIVLFSGDGDFVPVIEELKDRGILITVVGSKEANTISSELRRTCDSYLDLKELLETAGAVIGDENVSSLEEVLSGSNWLDNDNLTLAQVKRNEPRSH